MTLRAVESTLQELILLVIVFIMGGIGNQLWQYAAGRRLAHKWNTELKLDLSYFYYDKFRPFDLDKLNIKASVATPEEIERVKKFCRYPQIGHERNSDDHELMPEVLDYPDNTYLFGYWTHEEYIADVADILRRELTLKQPLSTAAQPWKEKILAAECSVSLHVRHGDFIYNPRVKADNFTLPLDYYRECVNQLKAQYKNLTVFLFSDDPQWCKENLRPGVPMECVSGGHNRS